MKITHVDVIETEKQITFVPGKVSYVRASRVLYDTKKRVVFKVNKATKEAILKWASYSNISKKYFGENVKFFQGKKVKVKKAK